MNRPFYLAACVVASLAAGCASAPQTESQNNLAQATAAETGGQSENEVQPNLVVDALDPAPESEVRCREMLKQGSNVIITRCLTIADWERFEKFQRREAQEMLRVLQGGAYR